MYFTWCFLAVGFFTIYVIQSVNSTNIGTKNGNTIIELYKERKAAVIKKRSALVVSLSSADKKFIVDIHNEKKSEEQASNMRFMKWSEELATIAQAWADECDVVHGQPSSVNHSVYKALGQNLYAVTSSNFNLSRSMESWYEEKQNYHYSTQVCDAGKICNHYTQFVWADTFEVGCGVSYCTPMADTSVSKSWNEGTYIVCNYGPAGNLKGNRPYSVGEACTECSTGSFNCYNNLCRDDCSGVSCECKAPSLCQNCANVSSSCSCECSEGWMGMHCTDVCDNISNKCRKGKPWYPKFCSQYTDVLKGCPLMCNTCKEKTANSPVCVSGLETTLGGVNNEVTTTLNDPKSTNTVANQKSTTTVANQKSTTTVANQKSTITVSLWIPPVDDNQNNRSSKLNLALFGVVLVFVVMMI